MNISHTNNNIYFGTTKNKYVNDKNQDILQTTYFARNDIDWKKLVNIMDENFENKEHVNVYSLACSDGSEPITTAIFLDKYSKNSEKYFPIFASDINAETINQLNSNGEIDMYPDDFDRLPIDYKNNPYFQFIKYVNPTELISDSYVQEKITPYTKNKIEFSTGNLLDKLDEIEDNSDTVVMCRNVLPYFYDEVKVKEFAEKCNKKLKNKSLVVIGEFDKERSNIDIYLTNNNFKEIKRNIYEKKERNKFILPYFYPIFKKKEKTT